MTAARPTTKWGLLLVVFAVGAFAAASDSDLEYSEESDLDLLEEEASPNQIVENPNSIIGPNGESTTTTTGAPQDPTTTPAPDTTPKPIDTNQQAQVCSLFPKLPDEVQTFLNDDNLFRFSNAMHQIGKFFDDQAPDALNFTVWEPKPSIERFSACLKEKDIKWGSQGNKDMVYCYVSAGLAGNECQLLGGSEIATYNCNKAKFIVWKRDEMPKDDPVPSDSEDDSEPVVVSMFPGVDNVKECFESKKCERKSGRWQTFCKRSCYFKKGKQDPCLAPCKRMRRREKFQCKKQCFSDFLTQLGPSSHRRRLAQFPENAMGGNSFGGGQVFQNAAFGGSPADQAEQAFSQTTQNCNLTEVEKAEAQLQFLKEAAKRRNRAANCRFCLLLSFVQNSNGNPIGRRRVATSPQAFSIDSAVSAIKNKMQDATFAKEAKDYGDELGMCQCSDKEKCPQSAVIQKLGAAADYLGNLCKDQALLRQCTMPVDNFQEIMGTTAQQSDTSSSGPDGTFWSQAVTPATILASTNPNWPPAALGFIANAYVNAAKDQGSVGNGILPEVTRETMFALYDNKFKLKHIGGARRRRRLNAVQSGGLS